MSEFIHRGVVEGFYGPPYTHADRLWLLDRLGAWGMNRYVYAPKDDPLHRAQWRDPYPADALREFAELVERGRAAGVEVGFAVSPGLTIVTGDSAKTTQYSPSGIPPPMMRTISSSSEVIPALRASAVAPIWIA